jgi:hypothetical protein
MLIENETARAPVVLRKELRRRGVGRNLKTCQFEHKSERFKDCFIIVYDNDLGGLLVSHEPPCE